MSAPAGATVLVTGAQGFVGSWLAERLLDQGARVVVPRRDLPAGTRFREEGIEDRCEIVYADVTELDSLLRVFTEYEVSQVFHLAAQTIVGTANRAPLGTFESNVRGSYTLLEACRLDARVERIVVASSDKAYGAPKDLPYDEDTPMRPVWPYDVSKAATDMIARSYAATFDLPVAVTRLANVYGGGDLNWSRIVPDTCRSLLRGERPVVRSDGTPEREYLYVEDAVDIYLTVADSLDRPELHGRAWNAGTGVPVPVIEVVEKLIALSGKELAPDVQGTGSLHGEIDRQYLDSAAIRSELGWAPRVGMEEGLRRTWEWYAERGAA